MPILDLQRRLAEVGRIRLGQKVLTRNGKQAPGKLETFRLTSQSKEMIEAVAAVYGGEVKSWKARPSDGESWEVITDTKALEIVVVPQQVLSQWMELWAGPTCKRRCDGEQDMVSGNPCICKATGEELCKPTSRLSVMLPQVAALGLWRLETKGWHAAMELLGAAEILEQVTKRGVYLPATLRLETRPGVVDGKLTKYPVPVIDINSPIGDVLESMGVTAQIGRRKSVAISSAPEQKALPAPVVDQIDPPRESLIPAPGRVEVDEDGNPKSWKPLPPVEDEPLDADVVAEQILNPTAPGAGRKPRSNAAEPIKRTGLAPRGRIIDPGQEPSTVEAPSTGPEDKPPVEAAVESEVVPGGAAPLGGDHPLVLAETQQPAEDAVSPTEALRAPLTRAQGLAKKAREAGLDDEARGDLIETLTKGRTRSSKEVTDNEAGTLHGWFHKLKSKTAYLSYDPEGKACLLPMTP